jgi:hypothetical protein
MKVHALGIRSQSGISKAGAPYEITVIKVRVPIEEVSRENLTIKGRGYEENDLELDSKSWLNFTNFPYPCELELETDVGSRMGQITVVATNAKLVNPQNVKAVS